MVAPFEGSFFDLLWTVWKQSFWTAISFWSFHVRNESPVQETAQDTLKTVVLSE